MTANPRWNDQTIANLWTAAWFNQNIFNSNRQVCQTCFALAMYSYWGIKLVQTYALKASSEKDNSPRPYGSYQYPISNFDLMLLWGLLKGQMLNVISTAQRQMLKCWNSFRWGWWQQILKLPTNVNKVLMFVGVLKFSFQQGLHLTSK